MLGRVIDFADKKTDLLMTRFFGGGAPSAARKETAPERRRLKAGTLAAAPLTDTETAAAVLVEPELDFEWPEAGADLADTLRMLSRNIEKALQASWAPADIYERMVARFPDGIKNIVKAQPIGFVIETIEKEAPEEALIRAPVGRKAIRVIHAALARYA